jgi:hypothetical protein
MGNKLPILQNYLPLLKKPANIHLIASPAAYNKPTGITQKRKALKKEKLEMDKNNKTTNASHITDRTSHKRCQPLSLEKSIMFSSYKDSVIT